MGTFWEHDKIAYGGDYNPEQWPEEVWDKDMELFKQAGIDILTLNVFSWATLQPAPGKYNFEKLDKIIDKATENNMKICLATSTAAHPAWMARQYPDILRTDFEGRQRKFGGRHNSCPNSHTYRRFSVKLAEKLAERYKDRTNIIAWHVSNEYGGDCYCDNCERAFRIWLKKKYETIEELNRAWNTSFWGHTFYDWNEIVLPNVLSEHFSAYGKDRTMFQGISLDYKRFNSDSIMECYELERNVLKRITPNIPVTTNFMGFYYQLDYRKWADKLDFISWDNYPGPNDEPAMMAMNHDLMRGLKKNEPFCLMEQTPSVTNWQPYNRLKRPDVMRLWSYQAVAHGADSVMFFQMRRSIGACEKYHGAVIDHAGRTDTRVFREVSELGNELYVLGDALLGTKTKASVAIIFDWDNWWATDLSSGPSVLIDYRKECYKYYKALHQLKIAVDIIGMDEPLDDYDVVIAPMLYMVKDGFDSRIKEYVKKGGSFVTSYFSGYVDENDLVQGAYPGGLSEVLGLWIEESDAIPEGESNSFKYKGQVRKAEILCDIIRPDKRVNILANYREDFYEGTPVITKNFYGDGVAYYIGTASEPDFYCDILKDVCSDQMVTPEIGLSLVENYLQDSYFHNNVEVVKRYAEDGYYMLVLNHGDEKITIRAEERGRDIITDQYYKKGAEIKLKGKGVIIYEVKE